MHNRTKDVSYCGGLAAFVGLVGSWIFNGELTPMDVIRASGQ